MSVKALQDLIARQIATRLLSLPEHATADIYAISLYTDAGNTQILHSGQVRNPVVLDRNVRLNRQADEKLLQIRESLKRPQGFRTLPGRDVVPESAAQI